MDNQRQQEARLIPLPRKAQVYALLFLVLAFSCALRLWGIRWGVPSERRFTTLYVDEYTPIHVLKGMNPRQLQFNPHYFTDPTFFYYQVGVVLKAASMAGLVTLVSDQTYYLAHPDTYARIYLAGRAAVVAYGLFLTALLYVLGKRILRSEKGGILAASYYTVIPIAVLSSHIIDVGVPVSFWLGASFLCLLVALQEGGKKWLYWGAVCAGLSISTKYTSAPIVLPVAYAVWKRGEGWKGLMQVAGITLLSFLAGTPYAALDFPHFFRQFGLAFDIAMGHQPPLSLTYYLSPFLHFPYAIGSVLSILCFGGWIYFLWKREESAILAGLFIAPYLFLLGKSNYHMTRYVNELLPFLLPFAGVPLFELFRRSSWGAKSAGVGVLLLSFSSVPFTFALNHSLARETDARDQASDWICRHIPANSEVGIEWEANFLTPAQVYMQFWKGQRYPAEYVKPPEYRVVVWDDQNHLWPSKAMPYWVKNGLQNTGLGRKHPQEIAEVLQRTREMEAGFQPLQTFERQVRWGPFRYALPRNAGWDWIIFFPSITIYQKNL